MNKMSLQLLVIQIFSPTNIVFDACFDIGSVSFICEPAGGLLSGVLTELLGRKRVMVLINVPFLLGWILTCVAPSFGVLLMAGIIHGVTLGLVEAPICTYIGEVCQPEIRGSLGTAGGKVFAKNFKKSSPHHSRCSQNTCVTINDLPDFIFRLSACFETYSNDTKSNRKNNSPV